MAAKKQALKICSAFSVPLLGVYSMNPKWLYPFSDAFSQNYGNVGHKMSKSRGLSQDTLEGLEFTNNYKGKLNLTLQVDFRVGEINAKPSN